MGQSKADLITSITNLHDALVTAGGELTTILGDTSDYAQAAAATGPNAASTIGARMRELLNDLAIDARNNGLQPLLEYSREQNIDSLPNGAKIADGGTGSTDVVTTWTAKINAGLLGPGAA